jgi:hypothetical protein
MTFKTAWHSPESHNQKYALTLHEPSQVEHRLQLEVHFLGTPDSSDTIGLDLHLLYQHGPLADQLKQTSTVWSAQYEHADGEWYPGHVDIAARLRYLPDPLIGRGLGTLMQSYLVAWVLRLPCVPVVELTLTGEDATSEPAVERRLQFWTNFGIAFVNSGDGTHQISVPMSSCALKTPSPPPVTRDGWRLTIPTELLVVFDQKHSTPA